MIEQSTIDTIAALLTKREWWGLVGIAGIVVISTEAAKRTWRRFSKRHGKRDVWFISLPVGVVAGWLLWPPVSSVPWPPMVVGLVIAGVLSFGYPYIVRAVRWKFPGLASVLNGDKRVNDRGGPGDIERRKR